MALELSDRYPGRFNTPTAGYPQGSFKNRTTPDALDGSYLEKDWANDKEGFFQSLLSVAGIVANGTVDSVGDSQYYNALTSIIGSLAPSPPDSSTTVKGIVELATNTETQTGTDATRAITPAGLKGAYGIGDANLVTDLNNASIGSFYASPGATNSPGSGIVFGETNGSSGTTAKTQTCIDVTTKVIYKRTYSGSWSVWTSIIDSTTLATETVAGVAKVSTQALTNAGADDATIVTPKKLKAGFSVLLAQNGYISFPSWLGGVTIQWGRKLAPSSGSSDTVTFNTAFPTLCAFGSFNLENTSGASSTSSVVPSTGSMAISISPAAFSAGVNYRWWAIGY